MSDVEMTLALPTKWASILRNRPESGMTYQIVTVVLSDGRRFERLPCIGGIVDLTGLAGYWKAPFSGDDIVELEVTHDRSGPPRQAS